MKRFRLRTSVVSVALLLATVVPASHPGGDGAWPDAVSDTSGRTWDSNGDGRIDAFNVTLPEPVDAHLLHPSAFFLGNGTDAPNGVSKTPTTGIHRNYTIFFPDAKGIDTASVPELFWTDEQGRKEPIINRSDGARPVVVAAYPTGAASPENKTVVVYFSEPVEKGSNCSGVPDEDLFVYEGANVTNVSLDISDPRFAVLTLTAAWMDGDTVQANHTETESGLCALTETPAGNASLLASVAPSTVTMPTMMRAEGRINSSTVLVQFSAPVDNGSGGPLTNDSFALDSSNHTITNVSHDAPDLQAVVTLNRTLTGDEIGALVIEVANGSVKAALANLTVSGSALIDDSTPPLIRDAAAVSTGTPGVRGAIRVWFTEPVNGSLDEQSWTVTNQTGVAATVEQVVPLDLAAWGFTSADLLLAAPGNAGTGTSGPVRSLGYSGTDLKDLRGSSLRNATDLGVRDLVGPAVVAAHTLDLDQDGRIDAYNVTFSEPINASSIALSQWSVQGTTPSSFEPWSVDKTRGNLPFASATALFSGALPSLGLETGGVHDLYGNPSQASSGTSSPRDGAAPVLLSVIGAGRNVTLLFSEPVVDASDAGGDNPDGLDANDFTYNDTASGGASGIIAANHTDGSATIVLILNLPLAPGDVGSDKIHVVADAVLEKDHGSLAASPQSSPPTKVSIAAASPGPVTGLAVEQGTIDLDSALVSWTAPGSGGSGGGPVASYEVKVGTSPIPGTEDGFSSAQDANVTFFVGVTEDAIAAPGATQTAQISGLQRDTMYHVRARALATTGAKGPISGEVTFTTLEDTTPPVGNLTIASSTHAQPSLATAAAFSWNGLSDSESAITYQYLVDQNPMTNISAVAFSTSQTQATVTGLGPGVHYLHVRGVSTGGASATFHEGFEVIPILSDEALRAANENLTYNVSREHGVNVITWQMPPDELLPVSVTSLQVWRSNSPYVLAAVVPAGSESFNSSQYEDTSVLATEDSGYLLHLVFRGNQSLFSGADGNVPNATLEQGLVAQQTQEGGGAAGLVRLETLLPLWVWGIILVGGALLIFLASVGLQAIRQRQTLASKGAGETGGAQAYEWHEDEILSQEMTVPAGQEQAPAPVQAVPSKPVIPTYQLECPGCLTRFKAQGELPIKTQCPGCSKQGILPGPQKRAAGRPAA